jgi:hypothetical protein
VYGQEKKRSFTSDPMGNKNGGTKTKREDVEKKNHVCRTRGGCKCRWKNFSECKNGEGTVHN